MKRKKDNSRTMALGGILAAFAVTVMMLGTIIPVATYVCPVICMLLLQFVFNSCGIRVAWGWYGAVFVLSLLLAPDKEAALVFGSLGYYPVLKPWMDRRKGKWLYKIIFFNAVVCILYYVMIHFLGMDQVVEDLSGAGTIMTVLLLLLGNVTFFLLDRLLTMGVNWIFKR